jgi:hypothetical protein
MQKDEWTLLLLLQMRGVLQLQSCSCVTGAVGKQLLQIQRSSNTKIWHSLLVVLCPISQSR